MVLFQLFWGFSNLRICGNSWHKEMVHSRTITQKCTFPFNCKNFPYFLTINGFPKGLKRVLNKHTRSATKAVQNVTRIPKNHVKVVVNILWFMISVLKNARQWFYHVVRSKIYLLFHNSGQQITSGIVQCWITYRFTGVIIWQIFDLREEWLLSLSTP